MISRIVHRREYLGETVNFKTRRSEFQKHRAAAPEEQMVFPNTHEAIVDEETWQAAQRIFHPEMSNAPGKPCVFTGLMICGECGVPMCFHRYARHEEINDFVCRTHRKSASYAERLCTHNSIRVSVISDIVRDVIQSVSQYAITDKEAFRRAVEKEARTIRPDEQKRLTKQIHMKEKRVAELEHLLKKLYEDYALGHITEERFDKLSVSYEQEEAEIRQSLSELQTKVSDVDSERKQTEQFLALAKKYQDCTEITDEMIRAFVEKIVVYKTLRPAPGQKTRSIEVHLNFIGNFTIPTEGT